MTRKALCALACFLVSLCLVAPGAAVAADNDSEAQRQAAQPYNNAPVWREVRSGEKQVTNAKGVEAGVLIQTAGESWRRLRNGPISVIGGWVLVLLLVAMFLFYRWRGQMKMHSPRTGRMIERFSDFERVVHWTVAISFVILATSGLVLLFGKYILLPVFRYTLFSWLAITCKSLHNFVGPLFICGVAVMVVTFIKDNIPKLYDLKWIAKAGGLFGGNEPASGRFNAGEKGWFWLGVLVLGAVMSVTGLILDFPNFEQGRVAMQEANVIHAIGAIVFISLSFGHIYMGTIGMEGAYEAMRDGQVDEAWAKEHHLYWYNDVKAGRVPAAHTAPPATDTAPQS